MSKRLLLLSNSTSYGETFLAYPQPAIQDFLGEINEVLFVPYAGVTIDYDTYTARVAEVFEKLGVKVTGIHEAADPEQAVREAQALAVGGGNTFSLVNEVWEQNLVEVIRERVAEGLPYIGWSAGSNLACPTLKTTNDMPIVEPPTFQGLHLINFQINPHYSEAVVPNHNGETRAQRLAEFLVANQEMTVVGLPEGSLLRVEGETIHSWGKGDMKVFQYDADPVTIPVGTDLQID